MRVITARAFAAILMCSAAAPAFAASGTGTASVTVLRALTVTKNTDLLFGTVVEPGAGSATVTIDTTGARTTTLIVGGAAVGVADFTVAGEDGQAVTVTVPATFPIVNGANSLTVTTTGNTTNTGSHNLAGGTGLGSAGTLDVKVGGQITVLNTTVSGLYSGTFMVSATYN